MGPRETASLPCEWEEVEMRRCGGVGPGLFDLECGKDNETGKGQARSHGWVPSTQRVIAPGIWSWILIPKHRSVCDLVLTVSVP